MIHMQIHIPIHIPCTSYSKTAVVSCRCRSGGSQVMAAAIHHQRGVFAAGFLVAIVFSWRPRARDLGRLFWRRPGPWAVEDTLDRRRHKERRACRGVGLDRRERSAAVSRRRVFSRRGQRRHLGSGARREI